MEKKGCASSCTQKINCILNFYLKVEWRLLKIGPTQKLIFYLLYFQFKRKTISFFFFFYFSSSSFFLIFIFSVRAVRVFISLLLNILYNVSENTHIFIHYITL